MSNNSVKKVLVLGSGALKIGEAGEFDYSGSQAIKALKEEGIKTVLVNPNVATIQTSDHLADKVYFLPIQDLFIEKVIKKERPDGILLSFGGQTALNCGIELYKKGILKKYNVKILGSPIETIILSEDRKQFAQHLRKLNLSTPRSETATNIKEADQIVKRLRFPVMIRSGYALGGEGSGIAYNLVDLHRILQKAFSFVPHVLIERYLHHHKEIEYEVVRDSQDNCVTVCNMENMDPLGIHTGESIVIAPSQTLTNYEYHALRSIAISLVRSLNVVGECNVQFALNPKPKNEKLDYHIIELNPRLSRSSALASKATGYPLAYVAAKLALGKNLTELQNKVTKTTQFCFEPALDYVTVKIPRWDIHKFKKADHIIGSSMKSVGEVMGIGRTFEEAYQKAIRMLDLDFEGAVDDDVKAQLTSPTPNRMFALSRSFYQNKSVDSVYKITGIDPWFLYRIKTIVEEEKNLRKNPKKLSKKTLLRLKQLGFSDKRIGILVGKKGLQIRALRKKYNVTPSVFQIDTLAGEFPAKTNYLYMTYNGNHNDVKPLLSKAVVVLGSGPYRIGSSVEFDWSCVNTVFALKKYKKSSIVVNCNPETVSTDYDISDRLYFEELTFERIADINDFEQPHGMIVSVGGQTPNNRAKALYAYGCRILGTSPRDIERAENRNTFSALLDELEIAQPAWSRFTSNNEASKFAKKVGYPVLLRPSFVLSGSNMKICYSQQKLIEFLEKSSVVSRDYPVTVSKFIKDAKEIEVDGVAQTGNIKAIVISEHVELAGVHSGDATIVLPPKTLSNTMLKRLEFLTAQMVMKLNITGPFNIQWMIKDDHIMVIEANIRSSRTFPFISKATGFNLSTLATDVLFKKNIKKQTIPYISLPYTAVKVAQFSFARLAGADPVLDVEMASTGEVACFGRTREEAFLLAELSVGVKIPRKGIFVSIGGEQQKEEFLKVVPYLKKLKIPILSTEKTCMLLRKNGVKAQLVYKLHEKKSPNTLECLIKGHVDFAINITEPYTQEELEDAYRIRRTAIDNNIPLYTNLEKANLFLKAMTTYTVDDLQIKAL